MLLVAGVKILREQGLGSGAESLTFKRAFDRLRQEGVTLTNASVIGRVWENQAAFQAEVLESIAAGEEMEEPDAAAGAVRAVLQRADVSTVAGRMSALHELIRLGGAGNLMALRRSADWPNVIGIWALSSATAFPERSRMGAALLRGYETVTARYVAAYAQLTELVGLRLRPGLTVRQLAVAAAALAEGYSLREQVDADELGPVMLPDGPDDGAELPWTLFSLALDALAEQYVEIDPDWSPPGREGLR